MGYKYRGLGSIVVLLLLWVVPTVADPSSVIKHSVRFLWYCYFYCLVLRPFFYNMEIQSLFHIAIGRHEGKAYRCLIVVMESIIVLLLALA
ncbi:hypothetical protein DFR27_0259 [Umboniibacter marinipuniceus]|uniref:Uncharacterized protein n=1 Tax=Umboniibacter marinipuniceus TaxID=569599 RepID=A0A3M0ABN7_9GAMM|nr:hypothetical protein DFR27_0259 [Umboniibacter marinipuniceus]